MPYPKHWLLSFGGHSGHIDEIWNCGIRLGLDDPLLPDEPDQDQYLSATALPALTAWAQRPATRVYNGARINFIKFNKIRPDGRYDDQTTTHQLQGLNIAFAGSTPTVLHPLQVCCVLSWRTDVTARGPGSHGRIYSPRPDFSVDASGDVSGPVRVEIANSARDLLNALDVSVGVPPAPALRPMIVSPLGEGHMNRIDRVVVDSSLDVQRRRSNHQSKETTSVPVVYT